MQQRSPESKALSELKKISELQTINKWDDLDLLTEDWFCHKKVQIPQFKIKTSQHRNIQPSYRTQRSKTLVENNVVSKVNKKQAEISQIILQDIQQLQQEKQQEQQKQVPKPKEVLGIRSQQRFKNQIKNLQGLELFIPQNQKIMNMSQRIKSRKRGFKEDNPQKENKTVILGMNKDVFMKQMFKVKKLELNEEQIRDRINKIGTGRELIQSSRMGGMVKLKSKESMECYNNQFG